MKPTRTPLFSILRKAIFFAEKANQTGSQAAEIVGQAEEVSLSRRRFLKDLGMAGAAIPMVTTPVSTLELFGKRKPVIAIVGGGMAGLNALHMLKKAGLDATIYEASNRTGGRIFTVKNAMGDGTWTEFGGEFIDSIHEDMLALAQELGLERMDTLSEEELKLTSAAFFFNGRHYSMAEVVEAFQPFVGRLKADIESLPEDINHKTVNPAALRLDRLSISQYLEEAGFSEVIKSLLEVAYESEYGLSPQQQSSINLLFLIPTEVRSNQLELFGVSDERYKIRGGNQSIPDALATRYSNHIETNRPLLRIRKGLSCFKLQFSNLAEEVKADYVILTIPFTKLRQVELDLHLPEIKRRCIQNLSYGTVSKMMMGMKNHHWRQLGYLGFTYSDNGINTGWDNAQLQTPDHQTAGYSILLGGAAGLAIGEKTPQFQKDVYLPKLEQVFNGVTAQFNGKAAVMHWPSQPYALGAYTCYTTGQYTSIGGAEAEPVGRLFFAGEHCGGEFSGFMNGAAMSGRLAGEALLKKVKR